MNKQAINVSQREETLKKYNSARANLILMIALTVVNIILIFTGSDTVMLFSATIPYFAVVFGILSESSPFLIGGITIAVTTLIGYFLCWLLSKKHYGWLIGALVMFSVDTLALAAVYISIGDVSGILDAVIHFCVIYYLVSGILSGVKLKKMPEDEGLPAAAEEQSAAEGVASQFTYSPRLRRADENVKFRILAEADAAGHHICYRRVKRVNELVVDGYIYDEVSMLIETPHELNAVVAGNQITAKMDDTSHSCIIVNGQIVAKKLRLY